MKVKVLKSFRDKYTKEIVKEGATLTISKERFEEIKSVDETLVTKVEEKKAKKTAEK